MLYWLTCYALFIMDQPFPFSSIAGQTEAHQKVILRQLIMLKSLGVKQISIESGGHSFKKDIDIAIDYCREKIGIASSVTFLQLEALLC